MLLDMQGVIYWGGWGKGSTPNSTSSPKKVLNNKSAMRNENIQYIH